MTWLKEKYREKLEIVVNPADLTSPPSGIMERTVYCLKNISGMVKFRQIVEIKEKTFYADHC